MNQRLRIGAAVLWTMVILVLCLTPRVYLPASEDQGSFVATMHLDKVVHAGIFVVFAVLWLRASAGSRRSYLLVLLAAVLLAIATELAQTHPIVNREAELGDGLTDVAGALVGIPIFRLLEGWFRRQATATSSTAVQTVVVAEEVR